MAELLAEPESWGLDYPDVRSFDPRPELVARTSAGDFSHSTVEAFCKQADETPSLLLEGAVLERVLDCGLPGGIVSEVRFVEVPEWQEGRQDSKHGVEFGKLWVASSTGGELEVDVALKPFPTGRKGASNEVAALLKASELTGIATFEPLGVINNGRTIATVTRFEPDVFSFDNFDWQRAIEDPLMSHFDIILALQRSALTLSRLHQAAIIHNDAQIKNMAVCASGGDTEVRLIDLESAKWRDLGDPFDRQRFLDGIYKDISALVGSILTKGLWQNAGYDDKARAIELLFTEPYRSYLNHPSNKYEVYDEELHVEVEDRIGAVLEDI